MRWPGGGCARFIPTYVGHTSGPHRQTSTQPVHPHIRGAYSSRDAALVFQFGSSPHTWGIHRAAGPVTCCERFIPTYVGHTPSRPDSYTAVNGSSPHTWGIPISVSDNGTVSRFIPTYVGHTSSPYGPPIRPTVHPHIRGAYFFGTFRNRSHVGSSPHTWGIPNFPRNDVSALRFIPTYVGHTETLLEEVDMYAVHPHIRGAYFCCSAR